MDQERMERGVGGMNGSKGRDVTEFERIQSH